MLRLDPEKVAYWYLRLNGFLQIENFYVHPRGRGGARTDADILGVRFPHRAERLYDDPDDVMRDDVDGLQLSEDRIDVVIAEVKTGRCALNGPWTDRDQRNVHRVIAAIGCLRERRIDHAAGSIYEQGFYDDDHGVLRIRLVAIGRERDDELQARYPRVPQVAWSDLLGFPFDRFDRYRRQKAQTEQWDRTGNALKQMATRGRIGRDEFMVRAMSVMGVAERPQ